ncbi:MAG: hypothetical protein RIS79_157, partial [Verrucomicrobiota bacterium]
IEKHANVLREVLKQPNALLAVPGYLQSTMGEENMGYTVRRDRYQSGAAECANVDAELAGKQMPYDLTMILVPYGAGEESAALGLATLLSIAHEVTGQPMLRTLRFATLPRVPGAVEKMAERLRGEGDRVKFLHVLGPMPERLEEVWGLKALGTAIETPALPSSPLDAVTFAKALRDKVLAQTGQP